MCEYCGCQSLAAISELTREHDMVVNLIGEVRRAHGRGDTDGMAAAARRIAAVLGPHTEVEEHGLFPVMAGDFPEKVAVLEVEHRRVDAVLGEAAQQSPADPAWPDRLLAMLDMLRDHILKEQDGVFPAALINLSAADWDVVDAVRARVGTVLPSVGA
jgi:hemerythrin-like domain-containing protein